VTAKADGVGSLLDKILGRPLKASEASKERLTIGTGVAMLGLDALASTAYGPEAAAAILLPLGLVGLRYLPLITVAVLALLTTLYMSYRQTIAAYPGGGGAYIVAKDNLGIQAGVVAGTALLLDYLLNVAVGIAAGVGAAVSAIPGLQQHKVALCLFVLATLTLINLRGVRESGLVFSAPTFLFIACVGGALIVGLIHSWQSGGHPQPVVAPPETPAPIQAVNAWFLLRAFASGCTAMTGVEAVSNGVPLFREPAVVNARRTLTIIVLVLGLFLLGIGYLCPAYGIRAMDEQQPGYQTILSQLVGAVAGRGPFYYVAITSIFIVLTYSAQTSFADFPRVCRLLAEDGFLPAGFANRGRRLVFSLGIIVLAILSGLILIVFGGITDKLIPLFAVGAFGAFLFSQAGMVVHWWRKPGRFARIKLAFNAIGAACTTVALVIIIVAKFAEGAWVTLLVIPGLVWLFLRIHRHYQDIAREVDQPIRLETWKAQPPVVIMPIDGWDCVAERALEFALRLSDDVTAVHVATEKDDTGRLRELWKEKVEEPARAAHLAVPKLEIIKSPYRQVYQPLLDFVANVKHEKKDQVIAVIIPELVEPHWYGYLLHNLYGAGLRALLFLERDQRTVVINVPWYLSEG
jgi:amino acid transporter